MFSILKNKISKSTSKSQQLKLIGVTGFIVLFFLNVLAQSYFHLQEAVFFQSAWWSIWFPNYCVWGILFIVGFIIKHKDNNDDSAISEAHSLNSI